MRLVDFANTYEQEQDTGRLGDGNYLELKTVSNGMHNYIVMSTEGWALDEESLEQFCHEVTRLLRLGT
jgi:hypothetical protein